MFKIVELIQTLVSTLGCGRVELCLKQSAAYYVVTKYEDILKKFILPIKGVRALDYSDFKKVVLLMKNKSHLTSPSQQYCWGGEEGLIEIQSIKSNMNRNRAN